MARFLSRWRTLFVGLLAFAVAAAIQGSFHLVPFGARPVPWLASVPWVVACFALPALVASGVATLRRASGGLAKLGAVTLHVLVALGGVAGVFAADPDFPFGPLHVESITLPGEEGSAHLYRGGLFCSQTVWRSGPGEVWARRDADAGSMTCEREGHLRWDGASRSVQVVGADGRTLPSPPHFDGLAEGLGWGPH